MAKSFGPNAGVLVDMGHHPLSTNIEQIIARLLNTDITYEIPDGFLEKSGRF